MTVYVEYWGPYEDVGWDYTITSTSSKVAGVFWGPSNIFSTYGPIPDSGKFNALMNAATLRSGAGTSGSSSPSAGVSGQAADSLLPFPDNVDVRYTASSSASAWAYDAWYARGHWQGAVPPWPEGAIQGEAEGDGYGTLLDGSMSLAVELTSIHLDGSPRASLLGIPVLRPQR